MTVDNIKITGTLPNSTSQITTGFNNEATTLASFIPQNTSVISGFATLGNTGTQMSAFLLPDTRGLVIVF